MRNDELIEQAKWSLEGLHIAAMVRMSEEVMTPKSDPAEESQAPAVWRPRRGGDIKGREVQAEDCAGYIKARGGILVHTYHEPDTSAWKRKRVTLPDGTIGWRVERPVFDEALKDLKRGKAPNGQRLDGLVVYDLDRLTRDLRHLEDAIDVVMHYGRPILDTTGSIDLLTENGRSTARIMVTMAGNQSAAASRRIKRKNGAMQQAGIPAGGLRPFGWLDDKRTLHPQESKMLREAVIRIIEGAAVPAIVKDWQKREIITPRGKKWQLASLKTVLRNPRICGYRARVVKKYDSVNETESQTMEIVLDAQGNPVMGQWDAIISIEEWETLMGIIGHTGAPDLTKRGKNSRIYLLSGILRCGKEGCNKKLRAIKAYPRDNKKAGYFYYGCPSIASGGCGGVSIAGPPVDELIKQAVIAKFEAEAARQKEKPQSVPETWEGEDRLKQIKEDQIQADISRRLPKGQGISSARYFAILAQLEEEEQELKAAKRAWLARNQTVRSRPTNIRTEWDSYSLPQKRAYIEDALVAVVVKPSTGRPGQYESRLDPIWREED